jgi:hypothetical protein
MAAVIWTMPLFFLVQSEIFFLSKIDLESCTVFIVVVQSHRSGLNAACIAALFTAFFIFLVTNTSPSVENGSRCHLVPHTFEPLGHLSSVLMTMWPIHYHPSLKLLPEVALKWFIDTFVKNMNTPSVSSWDKLNFGPKPADGIAN